MAGNFLVHDSGGEYRPLSREELAAHIGRISAGGDFGEPGGEFAELSPTFQPPDLGSTALNPPNEEPALQLN
jgi:hypothetical protein